MALALAGRPASLVPLVVLAALAYGAFYAPALSLISHGAERAGLAQGLAFALTNAFWAFGNAVGPASGGLLADAAGERVPYAVLTALCALTLLACVVRSRSGEDLAPPPRSTL